MTETQTSPSSDLSSNVLDDQKIAEEASLLETAELDELSRLESLLSARTRSHGSLQRELERRDRLFREALLRISTSTSQEFSALRLGYDAAVARAIEAEVGRAELTFALDETRAQLTAAPAASGVGAEAQAPGVYAGGADQSGRLLEQVQAQQRAQQRSFEALRGELNGLRARVEETELAWQAAQAQAHKQSQRVTAKEERVTELRAETAALTLLAQTRAARIAELTQAAAFEQQEIRTLRAQMNAANTAQVAQSDARESDRQLWTERLQKHEEREQEARATALAAVARSEAGLREFLGTIEQPLRQLDASLDALNSPSPAEELQVSAPSQPPRGGEEPASERERRTKLVAAVRALQAATQSGEPTKPLIEELVELVSTESRPSARRRG